MVARFYTDKSKGNIKLKNKDMNMRKKKKFK